MSVEITKAVATVMDAVHRLKKDDKNSHGGYKYVSVDDVKDHIRPLLAKNGLEIAINETDYALESVQGRNGATVNARFTFEILLRHISGAESKPDRTTVLLPHTGAQTTGAAKSYALKEWIKGRFLVSTGEKDYIEGGADADAYKPQEYTTDVVTDAPKSGPQLLTRDEARKLYKQLEAELVSCTTPREANDWFKARDLEIKKLGDWKDYIIAAYEKHIAFISQKVPEAAE